MKVTVNGDDVNLPDQITIGAYIDSMGITRERVAVELNLEIIDKKNLDKTILSVDDKLEVIGFVGGG